MKKTTESLLKILSGRLAKDKHVLFAYVYGSILKRDDAKDIDVAVYLDGAGDPWRRSQETGEYLEKSIGHHYPVDVHALNTATTAFAFQVLANGRLICERKKERRREWEAHLLSRYQDIKSMLDFHDKKYISSRE